MKNLTECRADVVDALYFLLKRAHAETDRTAVSFRTLQVNSSFIPDIMKQAKDLAENENVGVNNVQVVVNEEGGLLLDYYVIVNLTQEDYEKNIAHYFNVNAWKAVQNVLLDNGFSFSLTPLGKKSTSFRSFGITPSDKKMVSYYQDYMNGNIDSILEFVGRNFYI